MRTETIPSATGPRPGSRGRRGRGAGRGALAGLLACGAALGVAELLAGLVGAQASPLVAVGGAAVDATPEWFKELAIRTFGERDKLVLLTGIAVVLAGFAVAVGLLAIHRPRLGLTGVALLGAVGAAAALTRPDAGLIDTLPSLAGAVAGSAALLALVRAPFSDAAPRSAPRRGSVADRDTGCLPLSTAPSGTPGAGFDRRAFLLTGLWWREGRWRREPGGGSWRGGRT